ncbi:hypothetical protein NMG60_11001568 [Bertholletia excelsa]
MDLEAAVPSTSLVKCCDCACSCSLLDRSYSGTWLRSVKRKLDEFEEDNKFSIPGFELPNVIRVEVENERDALREMVNCQQETIQDLSMELEEERNAAASAANEAMSMILRLQREKAEVQMEARQFKRFAEEKMAHDQEELAATEDLLYKREQTIQSLYCEVQAYRHRMMSYGLTEGEADGEGNEMTHNSLVGNVNSECELLTYDYPPLKCYLNENQLHSKVENDVVDVEKYVSSEVPQPRHHLKDLERMINQLERSPKQIQPEDDIHGGKDVFEKVIVGQSPENPRHLRKISDGSSGSFTARDKVAITELASESPKFHRSFSKIGHVEMVDDPNFTSDAGDDVSDRVYTIDSVKPSSGTREDHLPTPGESLNQTEIGDSEIKKLYMRLQALEADRESMRQALISMRTEKAQIVLLKEIAEHLCKEITPQRRMPVKKVSPFQNFSFMSVFKWIASFIFWRKRSRRCKYTFGMSTNNVGLLILLDKGPRVGKWRCLTSMQV